MADDKFDSLSIVGRHVPDVSLENGPDGNKEAVALPGTYEVGVEVGGRFLALATFKAGNLVDKRNKIKASSSKSAEKDQADGGDTSGDQSEA
jgi:hypothetical protein